MRDFFASAVTGAPTSHLGAPYRNTLTPTSYSTTRLPSAPPRSHQRTRRQEEWLPPYDDKDMPPKYLGFAGADRAAGEHNGASRLDGAAMAVNRTVAAESSEGHGAARDEEDGNEMGEASSGTVHVARHAARDADVERGEAPQYTELPPNRS